MILDTKWRKIPREPAFIAQFDGKTVYIVWEYAEHCQCFEDGEAENVLYGINLWAYDLTGQERVLARIWAANNDTAALKRLDTAWNEWLIKGPEYVWSLGDICVEPIDRFLELTRKHESVDKETP